VYTAVCRWMNEWINGLMHPQESRHDVLKAEHEGATSEIEQWCQGELEAVRHVLGSQLKEATSQASQWYVYASFPNEYTYFFSVLVRSGCMCVLVCVCMCVCVCVCECICVHVGSESISILLSTQKVGQVSISGLSAQRDVHRSK